MLRPVVTASLSVALSLTAVPGAEAATDNGGRCRAVDSAPRVTAWADGRFLPSPGPDVRLVSPSAGHYVPAGQAPRVTVSTPPLTGSWTVSYTVTDRAGRGPSGTLTATPDAAIPLPPAVPGSYEVGARLLHDGVPVASTCLRYAVGMPGSTLDLEGLPAGADWGGGSGERAAVLYSQLGISIPRIGADFSKLVTDVGYYDDAPGYVGGSWASAAAAARRSGTLLDVQLGQGGPAEKRAVADGSWERVVRATVAHYPTVQNWEAWNEPEWTSGLSATDYVNKVLRPFARAVHAANPQATVVGGSAMSYRKDWWGEFARAGGFALVDAVSMHPYTSGFSASWEDDDIPGQLRWLQALKDASGGRGVPIWDTESAWPSKGPTDVWDQADYLARKLLWERMLGVVSGEFLAEGGWDDWAIINQVEGVNPAGLAAATQRTLLAGGRYAGYLINGNAHTFAFRFTTPRGPVTALWSDGARTTVRLKTAISGYDELGAPIRLAAGTVRVTGAVQYLVGAVPQWVLPAKRR